MFLLFVIWSHWLNFYSNRWLLVCTDAWHGRFPPKQTFFGANVWKWPSNISPNTWKSVYTLGIKKKSPTKILRIGYHLMPNDFFCDFNLEPRFGTILEYSLYIIFHFKENVGCLPFTNKMELCYRKHLWYFSGGRSVRKTTRLPLEGNSDNRANHLNFKLNCQFKLSLEKGTHATWKIAIISEDAIHNWN
jgi:hypothetical protein